MPWDVPAADGGNAKGDFKKKGTTRVLGDWGEIFDLLAHEYGYTFDEIRSMTHREVSLAVSCIKKRQYQSNYEHYRQMASLQGIQVPPSDLEEGPRERTDPASQEKIKLALAEAMARKRKELHDGH